jgi:hypothetical protein
MGLIVGTGNEQAIAATAHGYGIRLHDRVDLLGPL